MELPLGGAMTMLVSHHHRLVLSASSRLAPHTAAGCSRTEASRAGARITTDRALRQTASSSMSQLATATAAGYAMIVRPRVGEAGPTANSMLPTAPSRCSAPIHTIGHADCRRTDEYDAGVCRRTAPLSLPPMRSSILPLAAATLAASESMARSYVGERTETAKRLLPSPLHSQGVPPGRSNGR